MICIPPPSRRVSGGVRRSFDDTDDGRSTSGTLPALRVLIARFRDRHDA